MRRARRCSCALARCCSLAVVAIRLESRGSPIYRQRRVGKDGRAFDLLKLRTMVTGAERMGAGLAVDEGDPRITRVGRLLRRMSLDELPNLVNVLSGEMASSARARPSRCRSIATRERQLGRLAVEPGITGWAQVNGRAALPWHERIELDLWYIEHWSLRLDLRILLRTRGCCSAARGCTAGRRRPGATRRATPSRRSELLADLVARRLARRRGSIRPRAPGRRATSPSPPRTR